MGRPLSLIKALDGVAFELLSTLMIFNLYPLGFREDRSSFYLPSPSQKRPILLLHGIFHNHSAFFGIKRRLKRWGWPHIYTMNLATYCKGIPHLAEEVQTQVADILKKTHASKIDIIAHSLGGIIARYYIQHLGGDLNVKHVITLGTPHQGTLLSSFGVGKSIKDLKKKSGIIHNLNSKPLPRFVKFISFWSPYDTLVIPTKNARMKMTQKCRHNVKNIRVSYAGHAGLLFSEAVCAKIASYLDPNSKYPSIIDAKKSVFKKFSIYSLIST